MLITLAVSFLFCGKQKAKIALIVNNHFMLITFAVSFLFCGNQKAKIAFDTDEQSQRFF